MPQSLIRGSTQILDGTIPLAKLVTGYSIPTANLVDGSNFIKRDGSVAFTAGQSMGGFALTNVADPVGAQDAMNLRTAQALVNGVSLRKARVVAVTNRALTGLPTEDSVTLVASEVILLTGQTTASQNGPWVVAAGAWTRPANWAAASTQKSTIFFVEEGTLRGDTRWIVITDAITVDTTAVTITQDTSAVSYTNGNGLSLTGNVFAVKTGNGVSFDGGNNVTLTLDGTNLSLSATGLKVANGSAPGQVVLANAANVATMTTISGDATISGTGVVTLTSTGATGVVKIGKIKNNTTPSGTINSANTAFTLGSTPVVGTEEIYLNGQRLFPGAGNDYTIAAAAVTMLFAPQTGDRVSADYLEA
jgi:hypothetical protein